MDDSAAQQAQGLPPQLLRSLEALASAQQRIEDELKSLSQGQREVLEAVAEVREDVGGLRAKAGADGAAAPERKAMPVRRASLRQDINAPFRASSSSRASGGRPSVRESVGPQAGARKTVILAPEDGPPARASRARYSSRNTMAQQPCQLQEVASEDGLLPRVHESNSLGSQEGKANSEVDVEGSRESMESCLALGLKLSMSRLPGHWPKSVMLRESVSSLQGDVTGTQETRRANTKIWMDMQKSTLSIATDESAQDRASLHSWVMDPSGARRLCIDLVSMIVLLYDIIVTPYALAWDVPLLEGWLTGFTWSTLVFWTMDMGFCFRTGFFRHGELEMRPKAIARRYLRTFFVPDLIIVVCEWLNIVTFYLDGAMGASEGVKFLRFSKVTRMLRIIGVVRIARLSSILERVATRVGVGGGLEMLSDTVKLLLAILWLNHMISCVWYAIGKSAPSDTGFSWLGVAIAPATADTYQDMDFWYQYSTAFHWSMTQMTPGSMQVAPLNTLERQFNISCLICGLLFFSTLVSSLSAKMMHIKASKADKLQKFAVTCRFLRQASVSPKLAISIQKQVADQMRIQKRLTLSDVPALANLSLSLRIELQHELSKPHLLKHPLFRIFSEIDAGLIKNLCYEAIDFVTLLPGSSLFIAGEKAKAAYAVTRGSLAYTQYPASSKVLRTTEESVEVGTWLCEAALWTHWSHVGTLEAKCACELMAMSPEELIRTLQEHLVIRHLIEEYAQSFHARLASAIPPSASWPTDLEVPFADCSEIIVSMSMELRELIGMASYSVLARTVWFWSRQQLDKLKGEIQQDRCTLLLTGQGEVQRVVAVAVLHITDNEGNILTQVGSWDGGAAHPKCALPGTKQRMRELPGDAALRVLETTLAPLHPGVSGFTLTDTSIEYKTSENYMIPTKYMRTIHYAHLDETFPLGNLPKATTTRPRTAHHADALHERDLYIFHKAHSEQRDIYAWLQQDELDLLQSPSGTQVLQGWLAGVAVDEIRGAVAVLAPERKSDRCLQHL